MQTPKRKTSPSRRGMRRSHDSLQFKKASTCSNCGETVVSHTICPSCGYYRGKQLIKVASSEEAAA